jgi:hypothetical protein
MRIAKAKPESVPEEISVRLKADISKWTKTVGAAKISKL